MRITTRRNLARTSLHLGAGLLLGATLIGLQGVTGFNPMRSTWTPPEPLPAHPQPAIRPVPHPRCFPEGTLGAEGFPMCPDGLIDNQRSI